MDQYVHRTLDTHHQDGQMVLEINTNLHTRQVDSEKLTEDHSIQWKKENVVVVPLHELEELRFEKTLTFNDRGDPV